MHLFNRIIRIDRTKIPSTKTRTKSLSKTTSIDEHLSLNLKVFDPICSNSYPKLIPWLPAGLRMSTTATAQAELLAAANELYKRMESEQLANDANDGEYWKQLPSHIRSFVETTYAHGAALTPTERTKSQAMLALAQTMVDEATSRFPAGGFPPPFDPSLLSDPKFTEKFGMKSGSLNTMNLMRDYDESYDDYVSDNDEEEMEDEQQYEVDGTYLLVLDNTPMLMVIKTRRRRRRKRKRRALQTAQ